MRFLLTLVLLLLLALTVSAQPVVQSIKSAEQQGINILEIDAQYRSAIDADPAKAVFGELQSEFIKHYRSLVMDAGNHLLKEEVQMENGTRMFTRIYFSGEGTVDHFFYSGEQAGFSDAQEQEFNAAMSKFLAAYTFPLNAGEPFAQCSPVVYRFPENNP